MTMQPKTETPNWPSILNRYVQEVAKYDKESHPRKTVRRYHGHDASLWYGKVHVDDIEGWVDNTRLKHYLRRWQSHKGNPALQPTTDDIYDIMIEADEEEPQDIKKPFHLSRLAQNIVRNQIQEPVVLHVQGDGRTILWDGNRRFFATKHIMRDEEFRATRKSAQWVPAYIYEASGDPEVDQQTKHRILTELNFVEKDHIPWPSYVKASEVHQSYTALTKDDSSPGQIRKAKEQVAREYGLGTSRKADRWIKMYGLAQRFKTYCEDEQERDEVEVELLIQDKFEYFDELTKQGVWGAIKDDVDRQEMVFEWLWDGKFIAFPDVRYVPKILADPIARQIANGPSKTAVRDAIETLIANDPVRIKSKEAANEKIQQFAKWLDSFKREDFKQLNESSLEALRAILVDVTHMLTGLLEAEAKPKAAE